MSSVSRPAPPVDMLLLVALYAAEFFLLLMAGAIYRLGDRSLASSLGSTPGIAFVVALLAFLAAAAIIARRYRLSRRLDSRSFGFTAAMNLITVALIFIPVEIALRLLSRSASDAAVFLNTNTVLYPRNWEQAAAINREIFDTAPGDLSYLVYDETLGWTVGRDRSDANSFYLSSAEGLRAARRGAVLAGPKTKPRIAIVGDSVVGARAVAFEESWGHLLEASSGGRFEVLNFGVDGYSIDQAYLRVKKDVLAWQPDIVILGFPLEGLYLTMTVYPFIHSPHWGIPFSKPRIVMDGNALRILNVPTINPRVMFAQQSIEDLPFLEYDAGYSRRLWQSSFADVSYVKRLLLNAWADPGPERRSGGSHEELVRVNGAIFREFIRLAGDNGVIPLIAYFPGRRAISQVSRGEQAAGQRIMKEIGVPFVDITPCVLEVGSDAGFRPNESRYSPAGNAAVAKCLGTALSRILAEDEKQRRGSMPRR
jgi:hypothetical protein